MEVQPEIKNGGFASLDVTNNFNPKETLNVYQKMLLGALGALTPSLLNLYAIDFVALFQGQEIGMPYILGYVVRVFILILYGSLIAYFHKEENNPVKLFQLGAAAPALITIMLGMGKTDGLGSKASTSIWEEARTVNSSFFIAEAQAQTSDSMTVKLLTNLEVKEFTLPTTNLIKEFWRGFLGTKSDEKNYAVIAGDTLKWKNVGTAYEELKTDYPKLKETLEVYQSHDSKGDYLLVVANHLTEQQAEKLKKYAEKLGLLSLRVIDLKEALATNIPHG